MKTDDKNNVPRVRIAVLGNMNVGKSGNYNFFFIKIYYAKSHLIRNPFVCGCGLFPFAVVVIVVL